MAKATYHFRMFGVDISVDSNDCIVGTQGMVPLFKICFYNLFDLETLERATKNLEWCTIQWATSNHFKIDEITPLQNYMAGALAKNPELLKKWL